MSRVLVAYFSASGVTKSIAEKVNEIVGGTLYEIKPKEPYTKRDLNWMNPFSRSSKEMKNKSSRPEIEEVDLNMEDYDTVYIGFPIWWGIAPTIVNTFVESIDLSGKKVVPFATSGGSGYGRSNDLIETSISEGATLVDGKLINRIDDEATKWIESNM